jgi:hypothetical protein
VIITLLFLSFEADAQVLSLYPNPLETKQHPFNEIFISRNKINSIVVEISTKREMDIIRSAHEFRVFDFDADGHLVSEKKFKMSTSDSLNISYDTLSLSYNYNSDGKLIDRVEYRDKGFVKKYYEYDSEGHLKGLTTTQFDDKNPDNGHIISKDSIFTVQIKDMFVQRYINDYNRPYKEIRLMYDSLGYLYRYRNMYLISKNINTIDYKYNDMGLLKEVLFENSNGTMPKRKEVYEYDSFGFPEAQFIYVNDELTERKEYLFREDGSLKAILTKDMVSNMITIWEMRYVE